MSEKGADSEKKISGRKTLRIDNLSDGMVLMLEKALELRSEFDLEKENAIKEGKLEGEKRVPQAMMIIKNRDGIVSIDWRKIRKIFKGNVYSEYIKKRRGVIIYDLATLKKNFAEWEMQIVEKYEKLARQLRLEVQELRKKEKKEERLLKKESASKKES